MEPKIDEICNTLRAEIEGLKGIVFKMKTNDFFLQKQQYPFQHSEMVANIMLAYSHLEDARMLIGKVLQAKDGVVSVYGNFTDSAPIEK
jgi:hypothetical protein